jgi:hypothetical protein
VTTSQSTSALLRNFSWSTTKKEDSSYEYRVYEIVGSTTPNAEGHYAEFVTLKTGTRRTRPQAAGVAKRWTKFLRAGELGEVTPLTCSEETSEATVELQLTRSDAMTVLYSLSEINRVGRDGSAQRTWIAERLLKQIAAKWPELAP